MSRSTAKSLTIGLGLGLLCLLASPSEAQAPAKPRAGGTVIVALGSEPGFLNPAISTTSQDQAVGCMLYEGLVTFTSDTDQVVPVLAKSWQISPDGRTYTFQLRNAKFHDGKPFTSQDVQYSISQVSSKVHPSFSTSVGRLIQSITTPDAHTVVFNLREPFGPLLRALACSNGGAIVPKHIYQGADPRTNRATTEHPIGTGPFKLAKWSRGDNLRLVRNNDYWGQRPYLDGIVIKVMPNPASRTQALLAGEVDFLPMVYTSRSDYSTISRNPNTKLHLSGHPPELGAIMFNVRRTPLDDVRVRQALVVATDRKFINEKVWSGRGRTGKSPFPASVAWANDPTIDYDKSHPFDPKRAAQMLEDAGYRADFRGIRIKLSLTWDSPSVERGQAAIALKAMWRQAGVQLELRPFEDVLLLGRVFGRRDFDVLLIGYNSRDDPAIGVTRIFSTEAIGRTYGNASQYSNPRVDALIAEGARGVTLEQRGAAYRQIQRILMRDMPYFTLNDSKGYDAASKKLNGVWGWTGNGRWENAWLAQ